MYTGQRLCHTLDWALSSVGDDVTHYVDKLAVMEQRLFQAGAVAAANHATWKTYGHRRRVHQKRTLQVRRTQQQQQQNPDDDAYARSRSRDNDNGGTNEDAGEESSNSKRQRRDQ